MTIGRRQQLLKYLSTCGTKVLAGDKPNVDRAPPLVPPPGLNPNGNV